MLRDYQKEMLTRLEEAWKQHRSVMVQMPTGTGKTVLLAETVSRWLKAEKGDVLIVAHRRELIGQIRNTVETFITGGSRQIVIESIQKLSRQTPDGRRLQRDVALEPGLVIIDEAHHALAKTYRMLWERWPKAKFLGLTATPCRLSGGAFTDLFDVLLNSWSIQEFIDRGWLSDFEYVSAAPDSEQMKRVALLDKRGSDGDYQHKQLATVMDVPESIEHLYQTYRAFASGKKGIVYAIDIAHARHIAEVYAAQGVRCAVIDSKTPTKERDELVERYRKSTTLEGVGCACGIDVLVNVDIFGEGFDVPEVEFIQLARPTLSLSKYLQQVGRGMRVSPGKPHVMILDNVGLYMTFGLPTDERNWQLTFRGRQKGKGQSGDERGIVVREDQDNRVLVNLEMVRIRRRGEKHAATTPKAPKPDESLKADAKNNTRGTAHIRDIATWVIDADHFGKGDGFYDETNGLEVMEKSGRLAIRRRGTITAQDLALVADLPDTSAYLALAIEWNHRHSDVYTVIDKNGINLKAQLYGDIRELEYGFFSFGREGERRYWDAMANQYYDQLPERTRIGYVDFLQLHINGEEKYKIRTKWDRYREWLFNKEEVHYNKAITIVGEVLLINSQPTTLYRVYGYRDDRIVIRSKLGFGYQQIDMAGHIAEGIVMPNAFVQQPEVGELFLH